MLEEQKIFFERQIKINNFGLEGQKTLLNSKVLLIGAGGLGNPTAQYLVSMGVGYITICDHDKVEITNLHRQVLFNQNDIGKFKAEVLKEKLKDHGPWTKIEAINDYFNSKLANELIPHYDLVIDCTDNLDTKFLIHDYSFKYSKDLVQASIHKYDGQIQVFNFSKNKEGCLRCLWDEVPLQVGNCNDNGVLGIVPGMFGLIQANEAVKCLINISQWMENEILTLDLLSFSINKIKYKQNNKCKLCNGNNFQGEKFMNEINMQLSDINPNDYTWLDIRIATADQNLTTKIKADSIITKTDTEIMHEFNDLPSDKPFIVICDRGMRSKNLAQFLRERGHENVYTLIGGFLGIEG